MDERGCPRCKTTTYRNPSLKLMVNVCGHSLCESCVDLLFIKGSGACPECGTALRRTNFRLQIFEDAQVEKEIDIRRRVLKDFNKKEEDFSSLHEYNDYLEMVESIVYSLSNNVDVESTKRTIDQYKKDNKEQIRKNLSKASKDDVYLEKLIEQEQYEAATRKKIIAEDEKREKSVKRKYKEALIDDLMFSDRPAQDIITAHKMAAAQHDEEEELKAKAAPTAFSTGIRIGHHNEILPLTKQEMGQLYMYCPLVFDMCGPEPATMDDIYSDGYLQNVRTASDSERAGGFRESIACQRALLDAYCGLYSFPSLAASPGKHLGQAATPMVS